MTSAIRKYRVGFSLIVVCTAISFFWGLAIGRSFPGGVPDFQNIYYGTDCLLHHCDPYNVGQLDVFTRKQGIEQRKLEIQDPTANIRQHRTLYTYLPTTFLFIAPFTILGWGPAHVLWIALIASSFILAAILMWDIGARSSPGVAALLVCIVAANSEALFATGNTAGIVVSLCVIAAWCFLEERFVPLGILCLVVSLALKPHDAGFVWLFFLLSGGIYRRRALQVFTIDAVIGLAALLWVSLVAPHWLHELRSDLSAISSPGSISDPTPGSLSVGNPNGIVSLQTITSMFSNNPHIYNFVTYLVCGILLILWSVRTLRTPYSKEKAWLALAAIAPLTILPTYHRQYDANLVLLTIPACVILWSEKGAIRWVAILLNAAAILFVGGPSLEVFLVLTHGLYPSTTGVLSKILGIILTRPVPLFLLILSSFYLYVYLKRFAVGRVSQESGSSVSASVPPTPVEVP